MAKISKFQQGLQEVNLIDDPDSFMTTNMRLFYQAALGDTTYSRFILHPSIKRMEGWTNTLRDLWNRVPSAREINKLADFTFSRDGFLQDSNLEEFTFISAPQEKERLGIYPQEHPFVEHMADFAQNFHLLTATPRVNVFLLDYHDFTESTSIPILATSVFQECISWNSENGALFHNEAGHWIFRTQGDLRFERGKSDDDMPALVVAAMPYMSVAPE